jgi:hypothetical protein
MEGIRGRLYVEGLQMKEHEKSLSLCYQALRYLALDDRTLRYQVGSDAKSRTNYTVIQTKSFRRLGRVQHRRNWW